jgi:hypothetical protein
VSGRFAPPVGRRSAVLRRSGQTHSRLSVKALTPGLRMSAERDRRDLRQAQSAQPMPSRAQVSLGRPALRARGVSCRDSAR